MGYATALGIAESGLALETQLGWHFSTNCYPSIPSVMVQPAMAAIEACVDEESERLITMPEGVEHRQYGNEVPAWVLVDSLRLDAFVQVMGAQQYEEVDA